MKAQLPILLFFSFGLFSSGLGLGQQEQGIEWEARPPCRVIYTSPLSSFSIRELTMLLNEIAPSGNITVRSTASQEAFTVQTFLSRISSDRSFLGRVTGIVSNLQSGSVIRIVSFPLSTGLTMNFFSRMRNSLNLSGGVRLRSAGEAGIELNHRWGRNQSNEVRVGLSAGATMNVGPHASDFRIADPQANLFLSIGQR